MAILEPLDMTSQTTYLNPSPAEDLYILSELQTTRCAATVLMIIIIGDTLTEENLINMAKPFTSIKNCIRTNYIHLAL